MKKNAMLKIAAILMVAVLLTTCAISSTFAKYTTSDNDTVSARVAKFGVTLQTDIQSLFLDKYDIDATKGDQKGDNSVNSLSASVKLVAPGTANDMDITGTVSGTPEVAVRVSTLAELTLTGWTVGTEEYMPLIFTVGNDSFYVGKPIPNEDKKNDDDTPDNKITDAAELEAAVEAAIASIGTADFAANQDLSKVTATNFNIGWIWAFEAKNATAYTGLVLDDAKDTDLAKHAGTETDALPKVSLKITQSVDQLDTFIVDDATDTTAAAQG